VTEVADTNPHSVISAIAGNFGLVELAILASLFLHIKVQITVNKLRYTVRVI